MLANQLFIQLMAAFAYPANLFCWDSGHESMVRNVLGNYGSSGYHGIFPNSMAADNCSISAYRSSFFVQGFLVPCWSFWIFASRIGVIGKYHRRSAKHIILYFYSFIDGYVVLYFDMITDYYVIGYVDVLA